MLVKYQGQETDDYYGIFLKLTNGITGVKPDSTYIPKVKMIDNIPNEISICIMGDGTVENGGTRENLEQGFGGGYFENILHNAYIKRVAKDYLTRLLSLQIILDTISNGITNIIELNSNKSLCHTTCTHNNIDLKWYKSRIVDKQLEKINWVIDAYNGKHNLSIIDNVEQFVLKHSNSLMLQFRDIPYTPKLRTLFLNISKHLSKYHALPTEKLESYIITGIDYQTITAEIIETLRYSKLYNEFIKNLAFNINMKETNLRQIPSEINDLGDVWFLSLNWCNSDINNPEIKNLIKVHGTCKSPDSIVLPTQEFRDNTALTSKYIDWISFGFMKRCTILYIWGASLTDYDVEIHFLISAAKTLKKIVVINPDEEVFTKVKYIMNVHNMNPKIEVIYFNPNFISRVGIRAVLSLIFNKFNSLIGQFRKNKALKF